MSFGHKRYTLQPGEWTQISDSDDANVTVDNLGVGAYQYIRIASGAENPGDVGMNYRTVRPQLQQTFTNLDEGTVLWASAVNEPVPVEVLTG